MLNENERNGIYEKMVRVRNLVPDFHVIRLDQFKPTTIFSGADKKKSLHVPKDNAAHCYFSTPDLFALWIDEEYFRKATGLEKLTIYVHELAHVSLNRVEHTEEFLHKVEDILKQVRIKEQV